MKPLAIPARMRWLLADPPIQGRSCGDCQACCSLLGVKGLPTYPNSYKPPRQRCEHQCTTGCAIYEDRPAPCAEFSCHWRLGLIAGDERRRPDRFGVMFTATDDRGRGQLLVATEVTPGSLEQGAALHTLQRWTQRDVLIVRRGEHTETFGPDELLRQVRIDVRERP